MTILETIRAPLNSPWFYLFSQAILGATGARQRFIKEYAQLTPGMRVLDIGCGPGHILEYLPADVSYCGFDTSASYIAYARRRYGKRGAFYCQRFDSDMARELESFDLVLMAGLLHHLDDREAIGLLSLVRPLLRESGSLITLDGCYAAGQSRIARFLLQRDRGACIREAGAYVRLASTAFGRVDSHVRHDLFAVPYTALVMVCKP